MNVFNSETKRKENTVEDPQHKCDWDHHRILNHGLHCGRKRETSWSSQSQGHVKKKRPTVASLMLA